MCIPQMFALISIYHQLSIFSTSSFFFLSRMIRIRFADLVSVLLSKNDKCREKIKQLVLLLLQVYASNIKKTTRPRFVLLLTKSKVFFSFSSFWYVQRYRICDNYTRTIEREQEMDKIIQLETCFVFY